MQNYECYFIKIKYIFLYRKQKSNILFVSSGDSEKQINPLGITLAIAIPLICILVLVIILLSRKGHKKKPELKKKKKKKDCLWAEKNGLTLVPTSDQICCFKMLRIRLQFLYYQFYDYIHSNSNHFTFKKAGKILLYDRPIRFLIFC